MENLGSVYERAAYVANLTYCHSAESFELAGYSNIVDLFDEVTETQAYILEDESYVYLVFRGSGSTKETKQDKRFANKAAFSGLNLHRGIWEAWWSLSDAIATELYQRRMDMVDSDDEVKQLVYCGHSLGGSIAAIAAASHNPEHCITFGSPPVGGKEFSKWVDWMNTEFVNYVLDNDSTPHLLRYSLKFKQAGEQRFINESSNTPKASAIDKFLDWFFENSIETACRHETNFMRKYRAAIYWS